MSEYILTHKHHTHPHAASGWRIHCGVEVTELSTNKQHTLSILNKQSLFISARGNRDPTVPVTQCNGLCHVTYGSTLRVYSVGLTFVSARTNKRQNHHHQGNIKLFLPRSSPRTPSHPEHTLGCMFPLHVALDAYPRSKLAGMHVV
jgi:hypothetical protein